MGMAPATATSTTIMIKFTATAADGRKILGIGLSHVNLERLKDNQPIRFKGEDVDLDGMDILIFSGKTEDSMAKQMDPLLTAATVIKDKR
jgi:hypothetical protein